MLAPVVARVRVAVRDALSTVPADSLVLVACSGGADSLALAAATAFVAPRHGIHCGLVTVDHQLQPGSAERAGKVAAWAAQTGFDPVITRTVDVGKHGGPEAAARDARYDALVSTAETENATAILLGHTRDDQAETVLLALARGAGPRGIAGMPARRQKNRTVLLRPFLDVSRADTIAACAALGLEPWHDPHNTDPAYARSRVRDLVAALGPGVVGNLARTAALVAADNETLDALAAGVDVEDGVDVATVAALPAAVRTRVLHRWARTLGVSGSALSSRHVAALDALVTHWHGQGPVSLPGGVRVARTAGRLKMI
jgi:tRNA(Ile)-lysidine synthase